MAPVFLTVTEVVRVSSPSWMLGFEILRSEYSNVVYERPCL